MAKRPKCKRWGFGYSELLKRCRHGPDTSKSRRKKGKKGKKGRRASCKDYGFSLQVKCRKGFGKGGKAGFGARMLQTATLAELIAARARAAATIGPAAAASASARAADASVAAGYRDSFAASNRYNTNMQNWFTTAEGKKALRSAGLKP